MNVSKNLQSASTDKITAPPISQHHMPRVLLAEDCPITALSIKELLYQYGYDVTVEDNGNAALKTLSASAFDFVLMDLEMPIMDGFEACRRLRSGLSDCSNPNVPVIGMSANPTSLLRKIAQKMGMHDVLEKPIDFDVLTNILLTLKVTPDKNCSGACAYYAQQTSPPAPVVLDKEAALQRLAGDDTLYEKLLRQLREILPQKIQALAEAMRQKDFETIEISAHSLAGSFGSAGAQQCMIEAKKICLAARSSDMDAVCAGYQNFEDALETFLCCLENELN